MFLRLFSKNADPCGYKPGDKFYLDLNSLTNDQIIALRKIQAEKIGKIIAVALTALFCFISAACIRYFELKYIETTPLKNNCKSLIRIEELVRNINEIVFKSYDISRIEYKICRDVQYKVTDLHQIEFPNQYKNAFGR